MDFCKRGVSYATVMGLVTLLGCWAQPTHSERSRVILSHRNLGLAHLEENHLEAARAEFTQLIEALPGDPLGYANLSLTYLRDDDPERALVLIEKALTLNPQNPALRLILAEIHQAQRNDDQARQELIRVVEQAPRHLVAHHKLVELYARAQDDTRRQEGMARHLQAIVEASPGNVAARLRLVQVLLKQGQTEKAGEHLETIQLRVPNLTKQAADYLQRALDRLGESNIKQAKTAALIFHNLMRPTSVYRGGIAELKEGGGLVGFPVRTFGEAFRATLETKTSLLDRVRFVEVGESWDLNLEAERIDGLETLDYDDDGNLDLVAIVDGRIRLFRNEGGVFREVTEEVKLDAASGVTQAVSADYDNDGHVDLYLTGSRGNRLYHNDGNGLFIDVTETAGVAGPAEAHGALFFDADHEGDLDLLVLGRATNTYYQNNRDGRFTDVSQRTDLGADVGLNSRQAAIGDFDEDGDIDVVLANRAGPMHLYTNLRQGHFQEIGRQAGLPQTAVQSFAVGDVDNDGFLDLFVAAAGRSTLLTNRQDGTFQSAELKLSSGALQGLEVTEAHFFDFDNNGFLDLVLIGKRDDHQPALLYLLRNEGKGRFSDVSSILPSEHREAQTLLTADIDNDGDLDLIVGTPEGRIRLLRNDGGNLNHWLKVKLVGITTRGGKNNLHSIGSRLEVKAGDLYQMQVVTEPISHFGLGARPQADVVRVIWTNGVPQNHLQPTADQMIVEEQVLKGSCAFLYAFDGEHISFVTDMMWRSALGMPLGIMGGETAYAFADVSKEYLKISGEQLQPQNGRYTLHITEELWETSYFDQLKLFALDHPTSSPIFVDERFVLPPFPDLELFQIDAPQPLHSAQDERGTDLLEILAEIDDRYVDNLRPTTYQGVTEPHDLILDLGESVDPNNCLLLLNGWLFPTDASINVAIAQAMDVETVSPHLQVRNAQGQWQTVLPAMGFPMGKKKTLVLDLSGKFLTEDRQVRIRTSMEIYWDWIVSAPRRLTPRHRLTELGLAEAELHYRGFSRVYRKGGRHGPHWFDYQSVSTTPQWRDLVGAYTRYGDVTALLQEADSQYIIMNAGDEFSVSFDAELPALPAGWTRDFLIYSEGWIKDGDLNTAQGQTVEPLPFHGMSQYPYGPAEHYPADETHRDFLETYNTREVRAEYFRGLE